MPSPYTRRRTKAVGAAAIEQGLHKPPAATTRTTTDDPPPLLSVYDASNNEYDVATPAPPNKAPREGLLKAVAPYPGGAPRPRRRRPALPPRQQRGRAPDRGHRPGRPCGRARRRPHGRWRRGPLPYVTRGIARLILLLSRLTSHPCTSCMHVLSFWLQVLI